MPPADTTEAPSRLALLQGAAVMLAITAVSAAFWKWSDIRPELAWTVAALLLTGHAWVLAFECALAAYIGRKDGTGGATAEEWLNAWWQETRMAPKVFAWRQPFRWRDLPDSPKEPHRPAAPAVFIHGFVCNRGFWLPWMRAMRVHGMPYVSVNLEPVFGSIDDYVPLIEGAVLRAEALGSNQPVLICHSMGGLAARAWLATKPENVSRVRKVITIGTPHRGTWLAHLSHLENGVQMRPDGSWLQSLADREAKGVPKEAWSKFVCWFSNTDNIVFPYETAMLPGADNRLIRGAAHVDLAFHPSVMTESLSMLASASSSPIERTAL